MFKYRPDIDGLRAVAVIAVLLFHLKISGFDGGYIGVDVFFVISGFLITSILLRGLQQEKFSLLEFWKRRIRRIFPVLFFVMLATAVASYFVLLFPTDYSTFSQSLVAQSLFLINIFFMRTGSYFAAPAETAPLLHTWSLAIEEQFYIVFPVLLLVLFTSFKRYLLATLATATVASFAYSVWLVNIAPDQAFSLPFIPHVWGGTTNLSAGFYFPLARFWELLVGALLAVTGWHIKNKSVAEVTAAGSLITIALTVVFLDDSYAFPGIAALFPVLATALLIAANQNHRTFVQQILAFPVMVGIGLISCSVYLWHWPLIVLAKQSTGLILSQTAIQVIIIATFVLSIISYHLIERPFRTPKLWSQSWQVFGAAVVSIGILVSIGLYGVVGDGLPKRAPEPASAIAVAAADTNPREFECFRNNYRRIFGDVPQCLIGSTDETARPSFMLWGDSHANAVMPGFEQAANETEKQGLFYAVGGCPPLITDTAFNRDPQCTTHNQNALHYILENDIETVFIVARWKESYPLHTDTKTHTIYEALTETIDLIPESTNIVILHTVPQQSDFESRTLFYRTIHTQILPVIQTPRDAYITTNQQSRQTIEQLAMERMNVSTIDPGDVFCDDKICSYSKNGTILYTDTNHLNTTGALQLVPLVSQYLLY